MPVCPFGPNLRNPVIAINPLPQGRYEGVGMRDLLNEIGRGIKYPGFAPKVVFAYSVIKLKTLSTC